MIMASEVGVLPIDQAGEREGQGPPAAGPHVPGRLRAGPADPRRGAEARLRQSRGRTRRGCKNQRIDLNDLAAATSSRTASIATTLLERMQAFGYTTETMQLHAAAADQGREGPDRLDGQRLVPGVPERQAADAVRLLQAALRPGDQPGDRLDPRGSDHVAGVLHRPRAEPARDAPRACPPACACRIRFSSNEQMAALKQHEPPRLAVADDRHHLAASGGHGGHGRRRSIASAPKPKRPIDEGYTLVVLSDREIARRPRAAQLAAGRAAPCIITWCGKTKRTRIGIVRRNGRSPRGASPLPAGRLRRRRDQSVPGLRVAVASPPRRAARFGRAGIRTRNRARATSIRRSNRLRRRSVRSRHRGRSRAGEEVPHGRRQGHAQGDGQDGHLDAAKLQGRPDLRGHRPARRSHRPLLRRHRQPHPGRRLRRARRRSAAPARARLSRHARRHGCRCCPTRASSTGGPKANATCGIRSRSPTSRSPRAPTAATPTSGSPSTSTTTRAPAASCAAC